MKIVLLCVGGISSSILAKRLQKFSDKNSKDDFFLAERYGTVSAGSIECDLLLIAPQISHLIAETPGFKEIPAEKIMYVSEEDYSSINVQSIYQRIEQRREMITNPVIQKERWSIEREILLKGVFHYISSILAYGLILSAERRFSVNIGIARLFIPLAIMLRYAADVSVSKKESLVLHLSNQLCLFMMVTPFAIIRSNDAEDISISLLVIKGLGIIQFAVLSLLSMVLYTVYNMWEDWFIEKNRFMMRIIRDSLCSGIFFLFVIILRIILSFFVTK